MKIKIVKVSEKGQIAIPVDVREEVNIREGDELILIEEGGRIVIEKSTKISTRFKDLLKHSEKVAARLWENKEDEIWNNV